MSSNKHKSIEHLAYILLDFKFRNIFSFQILHRDINVQFKIRNLKLLMIGRTDNEYHP